MAIIIVVDQFTKVWAIETLRGMPAEIYWGNFFRLEYVENRGVFLGFGSNFNPTLRYWLFNIFVLVALIILFIQLLRMKVNMFTTITYAMIIGGGVGNLIDRMTRPEGAVVDFMNVGIGPVRTGIFNVADMAITTGVILLVIYTLATRNKTLKDNKTSQKTIY